jgi:acyl carrier protein
MRNAIGESKGTLDNASHPGNRVVGSDAENIHDVVVNICARVLGIADLKEDTDIFDLGADSIHATQIIARLHDAYKVNLKYSELFENPTVKQISTLVSSRLSNTGV